MAAEVIPLRISRNKRIVVVGNSGSGKSFLSKELSVITGLPLVHLDVEFWRPNWEKTPRDEWIKKQRELISRECWLIDGTLEPRFNAADLVIFLDINPLVCVVSALKRHGKKRSDLPDYLEEKRGSGFLELWKMIWAFPQTGKRTILALHDKYPEKPFLVISSRGKMNRQLRQWRSETSMNCL